MTTDGTPGPEPLHFDTVSSTSGSQCAQCRKPITTFYYEAAGRVFCGDCARLLEATFAPQANATGLVRATGYGLGGAVLGAALYYAVLAATGYEVGLIAIVVGFMVGWSVQKGARGARSRAYQVLAVTLTYLAIGSTYVPLVLRDVDHRKTNRGATADSSTPATTDSVTFVTPPQSTSAKATDSATEVPRGPGSFMIGVGALLLLAAAMPLLASFGNLPASLISLLIIGFALRQAWRMNAPIPVTFAGPFKVGGGPASGAVSGG